MSSRWRERERSRARGARTVWRAERTKPVALVTGAAGGMGRACARALAGRGPLVLTDRDAGALADVAGSLDLPGTSTLARDLARPGDVRTLADTVVRIGPLGAVVHTAGLSPTMAGWREVLDVDLVGTARLLDTLLPLLDPATVGVCIASIAAHLFPPDPAVDGACDDPLGANLPGRVAAAFGREPDPGTGYAIAKRAVMRLCARLAAPWGRCGGRIVSVSPGLIDRPMGRRELELNTGG